MLTNGTHIPVQYKLIWLKSVLENPILSLDDEIEKPNPIKLKRAEGENFRELAFNF